MRRAISLAGLFACALAAVSCGGGTRGAAPPVPSASGGFAGPAPLPAIPEVASSGGVATLSLQARLDADGRPAFFWNGAEVAPTIRVQPGDEIHLHFVNSLPQFCAVGVVSESNLHFHGLDTSPSAPGDDILTTLAAPNSATDYVVKIDPQQPPGMYWYHPHPHGLTSWEVGNGMAGAIVVEGIANEVPAASGIRERVIILGDVPADPSFAAGESSVARRGAAARRRARDSDEGGDPCAPEAGAQPTINGLHLATIGIRPGETELLRVLNASGHRYFDLSVDGRVLTLVAEDGVPIHEYPGAPESIALSHIPIAPGGRAEFLVSGGAAPAALVSHCVQTGPGGDPAPEVVLGVLADDGGASTAGTRVRAPLALRRPRFYRTPLPAPAAQRTLHFSEDDNGFYINGAAFDAAAAPAIVAQSGTVEEWTLVNDSEEVHDFHIHQAHFVVESVNGVPSADPHWVDTVNVPPQGHGVQGQVIPSTVKVSIDFRNPVIRGTFVYHCHILDHEDGGMMAKIQVR